MPSNMQLHFPVVPEAFTTDVAFEGGLARVEPDVNLEPVSVRVLAGAVPTHQRSLHLTKQKYFDIFFLSPNSGKKQSFKFV